MDGLKKVMIILLILLLIFGAIVVTLIGSKTKSSENNNSIENITENVNTEDTLADSDIALQYFSDYKMKLLSDTKAAYELLDSEYSQKKYKNYEDFEKFVEENRQEIANANMNKYEVTERDGKKKYICNDMNGKYYIFIEETNSNYKVALDTYTIDFPETLEKYQKSDNRIKVGMNLQKVIDAINNGDYLYVYGKLDDSFKQNNFPSESNFKKYFEQNFENKELSFKTPTADSGLYITTVTIKSSGESMSKDFIMKLLSGTDFVMSFNVN